MNYQSFRDSLIAILVVISLLPSSAADGAAHKAAIFVENRAGAAFNAKVPVLEDLLTTRLSGNGYSIISRETATDAVRTYLSVDSAAGSLKAVSVAGTSSSGTDSSIVQVKEGSVSQASVSSLPAGLDRALSDNTSALRLAQNLGADLLVVASITSYGTEKKSFDDGALKTVNLVHTLRVSYKLLEAAQGSSLSGDTVKVSKTIRITENSQTDDGDLINELLDEAAVRLSNIAATKAPKVALPGPKSRVEVTVACGLQDLTSVPLSIPDIRVLPDGTVIVSTNLMGLQVVDATVEVNGLAIGSAPDKFSVPSGINKMRISREGFKDWERNVNFSQGQKFLVALQMSEEGYARWKDTTAFLFALKTGDKLTDGMREMMGGLAQTFRQSGYRVDHSSNIEHSSNIKADIKAQGKSLFDGLSVKPSLFK